MQTCGNFYCHYYYYVWPLCRAYIHETNRASRAYLTECNTCTTQKLSFGAHVMTELKDTSTTSDNTGTLVSWNITHQMSLLSGEVILLSSIVVISSNGQFLSCDTVAFSKRYSVSAILQLKFMIYVMLFTFINILYFHIITCRSMCTVPNMAIFLQYLMSCFPGTLLRYFLNDMQMVPVAPIITDINIFFHIPHTLYFYCKAFVC